MISDQLMLKLGMPWDGRDPRCLTKAFERFSLASEGTGWVNFETSGPVQVI